MRDWASAYVRAAWLLITLFVNLHANKHCRISGDRGITQVNYCIQMGDGASAYVTAAWLLTKFFVNLHAIKPW